VQSTLSQALHELPEIGANRAALLKRLHMHTLRDLLFHLPRAHQDRRALTPIGSAVPGEDVTIEAEVVSARSRHLRGRLTVAVVKLRDATGEMTANFFGRGFLAKTTFKAGARGFFHGRVEEYHGLCLKGPDYEMVSDDGEDARLHTGRLVPLYPLTEGITQRMLRTWIAAALEAAVGIEETLPERLRARHAFPPLAEALRAVHFPEELEMAEAARTRFAYEELFQLQQTLLRNREARLKSGRGLRHVINGPHLRALGRGLPFALTPAQEQVISEILGDMAAPWPMRRLLQGDVGSGKTIVALHAVAAAVDGGHQAAVMAPTEVLAEQNALGLRTLLAPLGIEVALLSGSVDDAPGLRARIEAGEVQVVAGTHALFQEHTRFARLGLVIVDEQHRFGVNQRERLRAKGAQPDLLQMSATPIPRTLALTLYGSMDLSVMREAPPGRLPVKTRRIPGKKVPAMYAYLHEQAALGRQAYFICPLIEESETRDLRSVIAHYEELGAGPLDGLRLALLHGRMDSGEKEAVMRRFKAGEVDVLFSTTVIEVGIDVPNATIMIIEDAAQFGLTQLHQLRGRVGRGAEQAYCFLLGKPTTQEGADRLETLCKHTSGFDIAEADLDMRGAGELFGARQAGLSDLKVAQLPRDTALLEQARADAAEVLAEEKAP